MAGRNDTGVYLACQLRDNGISLEGAVKYMQMYQEAVAHLCPDKPDYAWDEAQRTLDSVYSRPARKPSRMEMESPGKLLWSVGRFVQQYGGELRYAALFDRWYASNGRWWEPQEEEIAKRKGTEFARGLYYAATIAHTSKEREHLADSAMKMDNANKINSMLSFARAQKPISVTKDELDPDDWKAVAANGLTDLRTGTLLPHDLRLLHTRRIGPTLASLVYNPDAKCPGWLQFLATVLQGDGEVITFLQRAGGYALSGDISQQVWFLLFGDGNNGKSVIRRTFEAILGTYADSLPSKSLQANKQDQIPADLAKLVGVRGVFVSETKRGARLDENAIKQWTGGEPIDARFMRENWFHYYPKFKLFLSTNNKPIIRDESDATWRRIRPIPFRYRVPDDQVNQYFYEQVIEPELPGILAWLVAGCLDWQRHGLGLPQAVDAERAEYRKESNVVQTFLEDHVTPQRGVFLASGDVYEAYIGWCSRNRETPVSRIALSKAIQKQFGVEPERGTRRGFIGLTLVREVE
jgi:putative DNA primase/helicase